MSRKTWLSESTAAGHVHPALGPEHQSLINKQLKLKVGDHVWLAHRRRKPKVSLGLCPGQLSCHKQVLTFNVLLTRVGLQP